MGNNKNIGRHHQQARQAKQEAQEIRSYAVTALKWWEQANKRIRGIVESHFELLHKIQRRKLSVGQWLRLSPWDWAHWIGLKMEPTSEILSLTKISERQFHKWHIEQSMGGVVEKTYADFANETNTDELYIRSIMSEIAQEKMEQDRAAALRKANIDRARAEAVRTGGQSELGKPLDADNRTENGVQILPAFDSVKQ